MPMYFPDLKSIKELAKDMSTHQRESNKYRGIIPETEDELPEARKQLAKYMRIVWKDEVFALEIELAVSKENYNKKMSSHIFAIKEFE